MLEEEVDGSDEEEDDDFELVFDGFFFLQRLKKPFPIGKKAAEKGIQQRIKKKKTVQMKETQLRGLNEGK